MKKHRLFTAFASLAMLFLGGLPTFAQGNTTAVPFTETFDDDSHFTQGGNLPDGWAATKTEGDKGYVRTQWYDYGVQPNSGEYYLASENMGIANRDEYLFTPMMQLTGGEEYTISFYILATAFDPGKYPSLEITAGNAQTAEAQTVVIKEKEALNAHEAWTKIEAKFTPEADGKYCLALHTTSGVRPSGFILVDDISVDGVGGGTEPPVEEWEASIPYAENFDDAEHYDGEHQLPNGWRATGDDAFITANSDDVPAVSGLYYMVAPSSIIAERRDIAYSPLLEMEAGQEYKVSFYINMPGGDSTPSFKFTVGQDQANDMQETVLKEINRTTDGWERVNLTFTPETTGEYCFAFWALSTSSWAGLVCVDNFRLSKADDIFAPETNFEIGNALYSIINEQPVLFPEQAVQMVNKTDDADSYTWSVTGGEATISDPAAVNPTITFKEAADYTITLKAENGGGTKEISRRFSPIFPEKDATDALQTTSSTDKMYDQADVPAFMEDGSVIDYGTKEVYQNYVIGVNPYYRSFAERFEIPAGSELTLTSINFYQMQFNLFAQTVSIGKDEEGNDIYSDMDTQKKLSVVIYPEKDGKPDVANPIYTKTDLISNLIDPDYHVKRMEIKFDDAAEPVTVDGTFYVAFEFDPLQIELWDPGVETSRSFVGLDTRIHSNGQTTLWVKPEKAIPGSLFEQSGKLGEYVRADEFSQELAGYSFGVMPWVVYGESCVPTGIGDNVVTDNTFKPYASLDGNSFKVDGLQSGTTVQVYSANGTLVFSKKAEGDGIYIPAGNWAKGVYIITANGQSVKVVR